MGRSTTKTLSTGAKLQVAFDYLSLKLGNGRTITAGRSGEKFSGDIPGPVMTSFSSMITAFGKGKTRVPGLDFEGAITDWAENTLPTVWPTWNVAPAEPTLGLKIKIDNGKGRAAWRGVHEGKVVKLATRRGGRHKVQFPYGVQAMTSGEIALCEQVA